MTAPDFVGHGFLPPSIKLPVSLMPVHDVAMGAPVMATPLPTVGVMLPIGAGEVMRRPDLPSHT